MSQIQPLTEEVLKKLLPDKYRRGINQDLLDSINQVITDPNLHEAYRNNFIDYIGVLREGKYKIYDYLSAIKYCTHKLMGNTNMDSYIRTFPDRYSDMLQKGLTAKEISSVVAIYNRGKLVNAIMEQSIIPTWVINQDLHQKAINVLADLMMNANSEKVRADSANSLLVHLKPPEVKKVELDIGVKANKEIDEMRNIIAQLSAKQKELIDTGVVSVVDVAHAKIVEADYEELD